jgi:beta-mannosidase
VYQDNQTWSGRLGLRTVELDTSPDDIGRKFVVKVNGKPIFCKGFNWIPDHCFLDQGCDSKRVRQRIQQALDANANMLRVWGGGIYETDDFYDICDEMGMLVWQDFLFACAAYPEDETTKTEVEAEARDNVARLAHHPSLVLWNGCNENLWGYHNWWGDDGTSTSRPWKDQLEGKKWGLGYYFDLLPRVVKELSPGTPYWPASPWSGDPDVENGLHPNLATHGNKHIWEVWHGKGDYNGYREFSPRFCSEFGYQGPPNYATLVRALSPSAVSPISPSPGTPPSPSPSTLGEGDGEGLAEALKRGSAFLELHQKSPGGNERNEKLLAKDFNIPDNFDDLHYLLQLNQSRALKTGVEWFRSRQPVCMGTLYWQLNDCGYAVTSWSAIDGDGRLKPLWYATRRFYAPRLLTIQPEFDALMLFANNDSDEPWRGQVLVRRIDFHGQERAQIVVPIDVPPRTNVRAAVMPDQIAQAQDKSRELIVAELNDARATWFFASDRELDYPPPAPRATIDREGELHRLSLHTNVLLREVMINIDRLDPDAMIDDNLVTLLSGESRTFTIRSAKNLTVEELTAPPVFQCANRFGRTPTA